MEFKYKAHRRAQILCSNAIHNQKDCGSLENGLREKPTLPKPQSPVVSPVLDLRTQPVCKNRTEGGALLEGVRVPPTVCISLLVVTRPLTGSDL